MSNKKPLPFTWASFWWIAASLLLLLVPLRSGFASELEVRQAHVDGQLNLEALTSIYGKAIKETKLQFQLPEDPAQGSSAALTTQSTLASVHLGILLDNATACRSSGMEAMVPKLLAALPTAIAKSSRVTLISFTGHRLETLADGVTLEAARRVKFECDSRAVSGSPERALGRFVVSEELDNLPKVAWLFTSGNLRLPPPALQALKKSQAPLDVFLYNRPLAAALQVIAEEQARELLPSQYHFEVLGSGEIPIPAAYFRTKTPLPDRLAGSTTTLRVSAMKGESAVASRELVVNIPKVSRSHWLRWLGFFLLTAAILAALYWMAVKLLRKQSCALCGRPLSRETRQCEFPHSAGEAAFLGNWLVIDESRRDALKAARLHASVVELGTHQRSRVPLVRPANQRKACLAKVHTVALASGLKSYRLEPVTARGYPPILCNGRPVLTPRSLAHGDQLQIGTVQLQFVVQPS